MSQFVFTRISSFSSSRSNDSVVVLATTGFNCWYCECPLRSGFCGVHASQKTSSGRRRFLFIICSEHCQRGVLIEIQECGIPAQRLTGQEVCALLEDEDRIAGHVETISLEALCRRYGAGLPQ